MNAIAQAEVPRNWKVGVYAIIKNEAHFLERFLKSALEADAVVILDTGSTDGTYEALNKVRDDLKVYRPNLEFIISKISVVPWRFDTPRNVALHLLPADVDIAVSFDIDEVFTEGWVKALKAQWKPETRRGRYFYSWSHNEDGSPATTFWYDKIHSRNGFRWAKPVHEILRYSGEGPEIHEYYETFQLHHWPDQTKSRGQYLPLLKQSVIEEPDDDRNSHYYGRELMFYGRYEEAIVELQRHISLPSAQWNEERAASMRFIGRSFSALANKEEALVWFRKATVEAPNSREPWFELARQAYEAQNWDVLYEAGTQALKIQERPKSYICDPEAWNYLIVDYTALGAYNIGLYNIAASRGHEALAQAKYEKVRQAEIDRLVANIEFYDKAASRVGSGSGV